MTLEKITRQLVGLGYELGKMDCFALIIAYLDIKNVPRPYVFEGWTMENYAGFFQSNPKEAKAVMVRMIASVTKEIPLGKRFAGDIILLSVDGSYFLAIDGGNGNCIAATESQGVRVLPISLYNLEGVYRCQPQSQQ